MDADEGPHDRPVAVTTTVTATHDARPRTPPERARLGTWLALVRFAHSVFALPFAGIALVVASRGLPKPLLIGQVVLAMVAARTAAMAYNRYLDREIDALNPRTADRELPRGALTPRAVLVAVVVSAAVFVATAFWIGAVCGLLSPLVLAVLLGYSHAKRFTALAHLWLGLALGLSPLGAWVAVRGTLDATLVQPAMLTLGVMLWVGGFDVLYACQDEAFDRAHGLRSLVVLLGARGARLLALAMHLATTVPLLAFAELALEPIDPRMGAIWRIAVLVSIVFMLAVHQERAGLLDRLAQRFFLANAGVPILLFAACVLEFVVLGLDGP